MDAEHKGFGDVNKEGWKDKNSKSRALYFISDQDKINKIWLVFKPI